MDQTSFATPEDAEAAFYRAIEQSSLEAMMAVWADDDDIVCVHPGGARLSGVEQVCESWRRIFASGQTLRFRLLDRQTLNGMTLAVHSVYEEISIAGQGRPAAPVVATNIYMRTGGSWRMVVHHASPAPAAVNDSGGDRRRAPKTLH